MSEEIGWEHLTFDELDLLYSEAADASMICGAEREILRRQLSAHLDAVARGQRTAVVIAEAAACLAADRRRVRSLPVGDLADTEAVWSDAAPALEWLASMVCAVGSQPERIELVLDLADLRAVSDGHQALGVVADAIRSVVPGV